MGRMSAMGMSAEVGEGNVGLNTALHWHLTSNHYPPLPTELISVAEKAIDLANEDDWDAEIEMPEGIQFRNSDTATVQQIVASMHLEEFIDPEVF